MEFKFDSSEEYQLAAIDAGTALFEGQSLIRSQLVVPKGASFQVIANRLDLTEDMILANLTKVQADQRLQLDDALQTIATEIDTIAGKTEARFPNFSIEMETALARPMSISAQLIGSFSNMASANLSSWCRPLPSGRA